MEEAIKQFNTQFSFKPEIINGDSLVRKNRIIVGGMGGSHLASGILKEANPFLDLYVHRSYGLPPLSKSHFDESLFIASSYSGNTEETLDFARIAFENKHALACIAVGGKLIEFAEKNGIPYIKLPDTGIQPRSALGFSMIAIATLIGDALSLVALASLLTSLKPEDIRNNGKEFAESLNGRIPIIYTSLENTAVAYNWKIKFNETGKIPAFYNVFPELNHNEMTGFDVIDSTKALSANVHFVFIASRDDHPQVLRRMEICEKLYQERGLPVTKLWLEGQNRFEQIFRSLLLADWTALHLSKIYGTEAEQVPMVEEFKRLIA